MTYFRLSKLMKWHESARTATPTDLPMAFDRAEIFHCVGRIHPLAAWR